MRMSDRTPIEHLELWRFEEREAQRDADEREHMKRMLAHGLDWINDNASGTNERAFDGEDAEEWQRRSEEQGTG